MSESTAPEGGENQPDYVVQGQVERFLTSAFWPVVKLTFYADTNHIHADNRVGLLTHSIISQQIYYPDTDLDALFQVYAPDDDLAGFDFNRDQLFKPRQRNRAKALRIGHLTVVPRPDIAHHAKDELTPLEGINFISRKQTLGMHYLTLLDAEEQGFVSLRTYSEAYKNAGQIDRWKGNLRAEGLLDRPVMQVTPKGNGLLNLIHPMVGSDFLPSY